MKAQVVYESMFGNTRDIAEAISEGLAKHVAGSAARGAARRLRRRGYRLVTAPESFYVTGTTGPLAEGEIERARAWGDQLGRELRDDVST